MKIVMIAPNTKTFINFRIDLIKEIINKKHEMVVIVPEKDNTNTFKKLNIKEVNINLDKNSKSILKNYKYLKELTKILKQEQPDLVFSYTIKPIIFGSIAAKKAHINNIYSMITGLGYIYTNNDIKTKILRLICGKLYKKAFKYNNKVIFQNKEDKEEFINRKYITSNKCEVIDGSGVDINKFKGNKLPKEDVFLMISRGISQKGVKEYFWASRLVKSRYPKSRFIYIQADDNTPISLKYKFIKKYIDSGYIEYYKNVDNIVPFYEQSKIVVLPSYYGEGIPRVLLEALSMGRPIITTNTRGCKETVIEGETGYFVPIKDYQELTDKMMYMIEHKKELDKMSESCIKYCKERFDVNIINKKMLEIMNLNKE